MNDTAQRPASRAEAAPGALRDQPDGAAQRADRDGPHLRAARCFDWLGWTAVGTLLLLAGVQLMIRGPLGAHSNLCDFANHYASARMWLIGGDPYDAEKLPLVWQASHPGSFRVLMDQWYGLLPPGALVALAPLASMPAWLAALGWIAISLTSIAVSLACAMSLAQIRPASLTGMLLISTALAAAPFQTLVAVGQLSLPVVTMLLLCIWCAQNNRVAWAGILLGLAGALKPQLAAPFGLFYLIHRNWKLSGIAIVTCVGMCSIGIAPLEWRGLPWWSDWVENMFASTAPGRANDPRLGAPMRHQMINLTVLIHAVVADRSLVRLINLGISLALVTAYVWLVRRGRPSPDSLLSLGALCALTLLPVYHRSYDAAILLLPYAWALTSLRGPLRTAAWCVIAALCLFLVPFDTLSILQRKLRAAGEISQSWFWQAILAPHHAWAALGVVMAMLGALYMNVRPLTSPEGASERPDETADFADVADVEA